MLSPPAVVITTDDDLALGEFGIATRMVQRVRADGPLAAIPMPSRPDDGLPADGAGTDEPEEKRPGGRARSSRSSRGRRGTDHEAHDGARTLAGLRHPARRPQRLEAACRAAPAGNGLLDRRPRLDERHRGERQPRVERAKLEDGDTVTLGETEARLQSRASVTRVDRGRGSPAPAQDRLPRRFSTSSSGGSSARRAATCARRRRASSSRPRRCARQLPARAASERAGSSSRSGGRPNGPSTRSTRRPSPSAAGRRTTSRSTTTSPRRATPASSRDRDGVWVEDVGSTNGTSVNGVALDGAAQARSRRRRPRRRDRPPLRAMTVIARSRPHRRRPAPAAQRGRVRLRAAAVRDRRRDGRRAGRRARVAPGCSRGRARRDRRAGTGASASWRSSRTRTAASTSARPRTSPPRAWARR